jgi:1-phosphofructokinase family hexose kinase
MIITITANTGLDQTLFIPSFEPFRTVRATDSVLGMGSKGIDTSWSLGCWGVSSLALGFAAGEIGRLMEAMLHEKGVATDFVWVNGSTRWNTVIVCEDGGCATTITTSTLEVLPEHLVEFDQKFDMALQGAQCIALSGSCPRGVPLDFYPRLIERANAARVPLLLDSSGDCLKAGFNARPWLIKPNWHELEELAGGQAGSPEEIYALARKLQSDSGVNMVVTLGVQGAYALIGERHYWIPPLPVKVVSAAGAGDAVIAGLALALAERKPIEDGLRLAFAMATAILRTPVTADFRREDAESFLPRIVLVPIG